MRSFTALQLSLLAFAAGVFAHPDTAPLSTGNSTVDLVNNELRLIARQGGPKATIYNKCTVANRVALTFDDGPYWNTKLVADTLTNAGVKGTFFVNGNNWACIYNEDLAGQLKYAHSKGHQIGSHTWAHKNLTTLNWDSIHHQMWLTEQAVQRITGSLVAFMRPPYGEYNNLVLEASYIRGQNIVMWDFDSGDTWGITTEAQKQRVNTLATTHPSNANVLLHEVHETTVLELLPYSINRLKSAGYQLVTVAECLGKTPYQSNGAPAVRDATWVC